MIETEVLSLISKADFAKKFIELSKKYGKPKLERRISISLSSYGTKIDTRIKITNGKIHIVQKSGGEFTHKLVRREINVDLDIKIKELIALIRMVQNIGSHLPGFTSYVQQFENYLFKFKDCELKMYHQFGAADVYGFELEVKNGVDIDQKMLDLGLSLDNIERSHEYWNSYDKKINLDCMKMKDKVLKELLQKYLD